MSFDPRAFALKELPDPQSIYPVILPDGTRHKGTVFLKPALDHPNFHVGAYTYYSDFDAPDDPTALAARLAPYLFAGSAEALHIGKFCQIAHGTKFITASANHATCGATCFPFAIFDPSKMAQYQPDTRHSVIGHDVWFGMEARILPGARIGHGAIIGAGAVVRGEIPAYGIATGNPAQVNGFRFDPATIERLLALAWWDWPADQIAGASADLQACDLDALEARAARFK